MKRVVLCRPAGPRNLGTVLRAAANFGPAEVAVVAPERPSLLVHPELEQMSHGVEDAVARVRVCAALPEVLADCTLAVGFTARPRDHRETLPWPEVLPRALAEHEAGGRVALVFGNEESGLSGAETEHLAELAHVATSQEHTSLNLGMAVGIVLFTLFRSSAPAGFRRVGSPLTGAERAYLVEHVADGLGALMLTDAARRDFRASVERLFARADLEARDARAWHQLLRAIGNARSPADYGIAPDGAGERR